MSIRIATIGVCHWHSLYDNAYLRHLNEMQDVFIVGIHDEDQDVATHRALELGGNIATFTDYRKMVSALKPDFVLALGRHDQMTEIAHYLLDSRVPFLMEKPMSFNSKDLYSVVEKAKATSGFAAVPLMNRFSTPIQAAKRIIDERIYGPMSHFYYRLNRPTSLRYVNWGSAWLLNPTASNGGCLRNLGNHGFDCLVYLTRETEVIEVTGAQLSWSTHRQPVEDYASVLLRSEDGVLGTIEVGNTFPWDGTDAECEITFRDALLVSKDGFTRIHTSNGTEEIAEDAVSAIPDLLRHTLSAAQLGESPPVGVDDCYRAVRLIDLAYIAAGNPYGTAET